MKKNVPFITLILLLFVSITFAQELPGIIAKTGSQSFKNPDTRGRMAKNIRSTPKMVTNEVNLNTTSDKVLNLIALSPENVIISNLNEAVEDYGTADEEIIFGQSFKTDNNKYILESITLSIEESEGSPLTAILKLYNADSEGEIGNLEVSFNPPVKVGNNLYDFSPVSTQVLTGNTIYWLVFNSSSNTNFNYTTSLDNDGPGSFPSTKLWAESQDGGQTFDFYGDDEPFLFAVYGIKLPLSWTGYSNSDWFTSTNWEPQVVPTMADDVVIPPGRTNYPTISSGSPLFNSLIIQSDATGTGSFITNLTPAGVANIQRYMTGNAWHLISTPVGSMGINTFLTSNTAIPTKETDTRGMMDYNPASNNWNTFFTNSTAGNLITGKGYAVRTSNDAAVTFSGNINAGNLNISGLSAGNWNLTGNPYTSSVGITSSATTIQNFLALNASNLDPSFQALYIWEESAGQYKIISNVNVPGKSLNQNYVQPAQGFFVKMASGKTDISFSSAMQAHVSETTAPFKSATIPWPFITLNATSGDKSSSASITFNEAMTRGLDASFDIGAFNFGSDLQITTRLINDNGVQFAIQALPFYNFEEMEIPVDIKTISGGVIEISAQASGFSKGISFILEDRSLNTSFPITDSDASHKVEMAANSSSSGRFFLVPSSSVTNITNEISLEKIKAYIQHGQIVIDGNTPKGSRVTLLDTNGRSILMKQLIYTNRNMIDIPLLAPGLYILNINTNGKQATIKLPVTGKF